MTSRLRRFAAAASAFLLTLSAAGCATIPHGGQIGTAAVEESENDVQSRTDPDGPAPGASPASIVRGFLAAGSSSSGSFAVARSFLTDDLAGEWSPLKNVSIVEAGLSLESLTASVTTNSRNVSFAVPVQASLDSSHVYRDSPSGTETKLEFSLRQVNGEWRISDAPDGIVLSEANFNRIFQAYPLYFFTQDYSYLVPDVRWFVRGNGTLTEVARQLLKGPGEHLRGAVISAVPEGTTLEPSVVTAEGGTVDVGLSQEVGDLDDTTSKRLYSQISQTMRANTSISDVRVQTPQSNIPSGSDVSADLPVDAAAVVVSSGRIARVAGNSFDPVENSPKVSDKVLPAQSYDGQSYYYTSENRKQIERFSAEKDVETLITGHGFVSPSVDRFEWVYTVEAKSAEIRAVGKTGELVSMAMPFAKDRTVQRIAVSREGSRLAVLSSGAGGTRIDVVGIVRSREGKPDRLSAGDPLPVGQKFGQVLDFSWAGSSFLAVLSEDEAAANAHRLWTGGPSVGLGAIADGLTISAAGDLGSMRVGSDNGVVYTYTSGTWQRVVGAKAWNPMYPG
ncbi:LpqB family beta-propeller domain-containing protein [Brevibacterium sp. HMSC07C04]|uniref:LpqB family beta-propeller domain-containing protein n=1 Tax=Brevibacterium sp. HMSC07C04 TaxID=1581130 RepID=UPI0008A56A12|nr:LpqB family beta-propeller domain-containing protein [Brevibacterium sp. HMSC07C04]OFS26753.1 hypothetical protein HMPREF3162_04835 [Brevibacterium sp. HMSC07C04]